MMAPQVLLLIGVYRSMDINIKSFIFMTLVLTSYGFTDDLEEIEINFNSGIKLDLNQKNTVKLNYPDLNFTNKKVFKIEDGLINEIKRMNDLSPKSEKQLVLNDNEYITIKGIDNREKLFNGSIIIEFNILPSFDVFAFGNDLIFISDLSDINRGVFKIQNLNALQEKINNLQKDSNILSIELDALDPSITNK